MRLTISLLSLSASQPCQAETYTIRLSCTAESLFYKLVQIYIYVQHSEAYGDHTQSKNWRQYKDWQCKDWHQRLPARAASALQRRAQALIVMYRDACPLLRVRCHLP